MTSRPLHIRAVPVEVIERIKAVQAGWAWDISFAEAVRQCIYKGLELLERGE